eukprot:CAMPEP_0179204294 /NCGR_PEP_ID=MMETSP0796-20121207/101841_1 /TAXON_ID=73915 /ORGANISM="Pyrodinium bahamense, Strain pbaha01" /LENGTH=66 /DNA_ID=CAMNT_0020909171 /DNA_START=455 /DNA_END=653 /DNA_ORIENTATION=+
MSCQGPSSTRPPAKVVPEAAAVDAPDVPAVADEPAWVLIPDMHAIKSEDTSKSSSTLTTEVVRTRW